MPERRLLSCIAEWPECYTGGYDPRCCRFPKSCSAGVYGDETPEELLEPEQIRHAEWCPPEEDDHIDCWCVKIRKSFMNHE